MKVIKKIGISGLTFFLIWQIVGCAPINRFTQIKKVPGEYTVNYCAGEIKPRHSLFWWQKDAWTVFSDCESNPTYRKPGGKVTLKNLRFMESCMVIGRKGEYLRLMKYSPDVVENGKIKDRKKAVYLGWVHRSKLLLTRQSVTDIRSGLTNKYLTIFSGVRLFDKADSFFENDSLYTFKDADLIAKNRKIPFYHLAYRMKLSADRKKTLLSSVPVLPVDSVSEKALGWVDNSLLESVGQQLHLDMRTLPEQQRKSLSLDDDETFHLSYGDQAVQYAPVISYVDQDSVVGFSTGIPAEAIDKKANYVFNVNGAPIYYGQFGQLQKDLRKINVVFVMEGKEYAISQMPAFANVIQTLQAAFEKPDDSFTYQFGLVLPFRERNKANTFPAIGLEKNYTRMIDFLADKINRIQQIVPSESGNWPGIRRAVDLLKGHEAETNVIIVAGETGNNSEWADSTLVNRLADANCRLLGFQLYGGQSDHYNNFVLQIENMIDHSAERISKNKKNVIVYADQLRQYNQYKEHGKNAYGLDFPERSMTQGWVVFPEKSQSLPFDGLETSVDTLLQEIKADNRMVTESLRLAFAQSGDHRNTFNPSLVRHFKMDTLRVPDKTFLAAFKKGSALWYLPVRSMAVGGADKEALSYQLLLSKKELADLRSFMTALSTHEVDYKSNGGKRKKQDKICDCPPEEEELPLIENQADSVLIVPEYASTKYIRRYLVRLYLQQMKENKYCIPKRKVLKTYSLARTHREITTCPTKNDLLNKLSVKDLKNRELFTDEMLDQLIGYFKEKSTFLEKSVYSLPTFTSNGTEYFWVDEKYLP